MKKSFINFLFVGLLTFCMGMWVSRITYVENRSDANIKIYQGDSLVYDLVSIEKQKFKYYLKENPRYVEFTQNDKTVSLIERENKPLLIEIDYIDRNHHDITFK